MKAQKLNNKKDNYFIGGYITNLIAYPDRSYISISMKSFNGTDDETIYIMIFKKSGFGNKKYTNPTVKILEDAYSQKVPVACVYYNNGDCNVMSCCYANFTANGNMEYAQEIDPTEEDFPTRSTAVTDENDEFPF